MGVYGCGWLTWPQVAICVAVVLRHFHFGLVSTGLFQGIAFLNRTKQKITTCHSHFMRKDSTENSTLTGDLWSMQKIKKWAQCACLSVPILRPHLCCTGQQWDSQSHRPGEGHRKSIGSAPQHFHSLLTQLVSAPTITPGKLVHMFLVWVIYPWIETKQELRKGLGKHSHCWHLPELDNYEWDGGCGTRPECLE